MKIATYNVWNSEKGFPKRLQQIIEEINRIDADIIGLQEVSDARLQSIIESCNYPYYFEVNREGLIGELAILSKHPIIFKAEGKYSLVTVVNYQGIKLAIANLHLPYDSTLEREEEIVKVESTILGVEADFQFIIGDYNCSEHSSVYRFLTSDVALSGNECNIYWIDLAMVAEERFNIRREMTLDLMNNPRWKTGNVCDSSARVDLIFMHDCYPKDYPNMKVFNYFGKSIDDVTGLSPSDHYGVVVDLSFDSLKVD
jgi:hypothetical protein